MPDYFDLIVLGSGPAAARVVAKCAKAGWSVAVIDPRPVGGTCALRGCNPKKVLVRAAELVDRARQMDGAGTHLGGARVDWSDLIRFKRKFTDPVTEGRRGSFLEMGVQIFEGAPRFTGPTTLQVDGRRLTAGKVLIATGAKPAPLRIEGADLLTDSESFMELDELPEEIGFIGGGYISFEFAHVAARAGARVRILEHSRPLERFDHELVERLIDRSEEIGVHVQTGVDVMGVEQAPGGGLRVHTSAEGELSSVAAGLVVHGAGRVPNVDGLFLEAGGIQYGDRGIEVNDHFQSVSNPDVYAAGDVIDSGLPALTPAANYAARIVAQNLLEEGSAQNERPVVPAAVFTSPGLAAVGLTEAEASERGVDCRVSSGNWSGFSSMRKLGATHALYKVLIDLQTDKILGAHLLGPDAAEVINLFALAMHTGATAGDLESTLFVFPTLASDIHSML
ncbi:Mercuric reductase [Posidoniimonas corsicana]|uniref:Mercuric reductase n=1 Tax=Posidoniimonas corsicana TaxID=1938618 RepID=A0A5C5V4U7_9BACT|nr:NAD(P)/FAD-dependent oxidoreductase [Posidoniimonas corsicana]TWT33558.1 Mercuric reductase [Posidoniimonas corsicana]